MEIIKCNDLTKIHGRVTALHNLSVTIDENTITGLIGRNGAGKTTLLKLIAGFWQQTSGDIQVFAKKPFNNLFVSSNTIFVGDAMGFPNSLSLLELFQQADSFYENWDMELAQRLFDYYAFHPKQVYGSLSKGRKSTFNMIFAVATRCALTIFDEPTNGMDASARSDFYRIILKDYLKVPRAIIISSHYLDEMESILENVLLIDQGKVKLHLAIDELKEYAIAVEGRSAIVRQWLQGTDIIYEEKTGIDDCYVIIKNKLPQKQLSMAKHIGIKLSAVSASDICLYVTNNQKRGIDDVLDEY